MSEPKNETDGPPKEEGQSEPKEEQAPQDPPKDSSQPPPENGTPGEAQPQQEQPKAEEKPPEEEKKDATTTEKKSSKPASQQGTKPPTSQNAKRPASKSKKKETTKGNAKRPASKGKKGKKGKEKEQAEKEAEEKRRLEEQRLEEERLKKEEEERLKKEEEERLKKEEEERLRLEEEKKRQQEEEEDKRVLYLVQQLIDCSFIKDKDDDRLSEEIVNKLFDFLDKPNLVQLYLKYKDDTETELICRENILELYDPTVNKNAIDGNLNPGGSNFISRSDYEFCFFLKKKPCRISKKHMHEQIVFDKVDGNIDKYLLDKMKESLSERIFNLNWPEGIKNDLISNMHKFLIILNQSYFQELNKVVLYIPRENVSGSEASKDKELVARLESIMIEWTNQIRDFLSNQDNASNREDFDINEEIAYLESRNSNLAAISDQLENKELTDIVNTLSKTRASSENLKGFKDLKDKILEQKYITSDTHRFLKILKNPCDKIRNPKTEIKEIKPILIEIMNKIRVITEFCNTYKTPEDVDNLLKKVSFQLIHKFTQKIQENDKNIMTEYNDKLYQNILDINKCINDWVGIYNQFQERIEMFEKNEDLKKNGKKKKSILKLYFMN